MAQTKAQLLAGKSDQSVTFNDVTASSLNGGPFGGRNRIINGDMRIDQRNAGAAVTTSGAYVVDRFCQTQSGGGVISWARSTVAPAGFTNSLSGTVSTADTSIAAGDIYRVYQIIEGFNSADLSFGSASAKTVTLSFWVRSSITGTYCVGLQNGSFNRSYATNYTISAANTWEYKTITIAGDTSGTWATDNSWGIAVFWDLGTGSSYNQSADTWSATNTWKTSSQTSWIATNGATFYITGVQLEAGSVATPFERRSYGQELALCQRYAVVYGRDQAYNQIGGTGFAYSATNCDAPVSLPVQMRSTPTTTTSGSFQLSDGVSALAITTISLIGQQSSTLIASLQAARASGLTAAKPYRIETANSTTAYVLFSAEL